MDQNPDISEDLVDRNEKAPEPTQGPWVFPTINVRELIQKSLEIAWEASPGSCGVSEVDILVAVNNLRHAAAELERSLLEEKYGVSR